MRALPLPLVLTVTLLGLALLLGGLVRAGLTWRRPHLAPASPGAGAETQTWA